MCRRKNPLLTQPSPSIGEGAEGSSILGASFNFTNSIIGAGIVGLPSALNAAGFISGIALCVLVSVLTDITSKFCGIISHCWRGISTSISSPLVSESGFGARCGELRRLV